MNIDFHDIFSQKFSSLDIKSSFGENKTTLFAERKIHNLWKRIYKDSKIKEKAVDLIKNEFVSKLVILKYNPEKEGIDSIPFASYEAMNRKDEKKHEQLKQNCLKLREALLSLAESSDEAAYFITKVFAQRKFVFSFADDETLQNMCIPDTFAGLYNQYLKTIIIPSFSIEDKFFNPSLFQEILCHELTHAADDFAVLDTDPEQPAILSQDVFKKEILLMLNNEFEKNKKLMGDLLKIRKDKIAKENPYLSDEELKRELDESTKEKPLYKIENKNSEELNLVKNSTWCWYETTEEFTLVPFIAYLVKNFDITTRKDSNRLALEYIGYGVQFLLSNDKTKKERLQKQDPEFCNYLKNEFIPTL